MEKRLNEDFGKMVPEGPRLFFYAVTSVEIFFEFGLLFASVVVVLTYRLCHGMIVNRIFRDV